MNERMKEHGAFAEIESLINVDMNGFGVQELKYIMQSCRILFKIDVVQISNNVGAFQHFSFMAIFFKIKIFEIIKIEHMP